MKRYAVMAALALGMGNMAQAAIIDLGPELPPPAAQAAAAVTTPPLPDLAVTRHEHVIAPLTGMSELPEPEVFAMMLVGLMLIGYRASRGSSDKFK